MVRSYRDLLAWQVSIELAEAAYSLASQLPRHELYGLVSQIRRAAVSVSANIAEGHGREHLGDYLHHLSIALGSVAEPETLLVLSHRLYHPDRQALTRTMWLADRSGSLLNALIKSLKRRPRHPRTPSTEHRAP